MKSLKIGAALDNTLVHLSSNYELFGTNIGFPSDGIDMQNFNIERGIGDCRESSKNLLADAGACQANRCCRNSRTWTLHADHFAKDWREHQFIANVGKSLSTCGQIKVLGASPMDGKRAPSAII